MRTLVVISLVVLTGISCKNSANDKKFTVSGVISNSTAKMIYLEKVPSASMQPTIADSAVIEKNGKFSLKADAGESVVFNLRLDKNMYPVASVINDVQKVQLNIQLSKENNEFAEKYEVEGSPASLQMKDYMYAFNNDLQQIFILTKKVDSLKNAGLADSLLFPFMAEHKVLADKVRDNSLQALAQAKDPALIMFELGYYQSTANGAGFGLEPLSNEQVAEIVDNAAKKFPQHQAVAAIKATLDNETKRAAQASLVGKEAPDFSMPDVNGKEVTLSSFKGKFVLVDFWASWCGPCRQENPNVVKAYQQYKNKNFTILGVSLDRPGQKDKWLKAIKDDKLEWTHISDLQYWQSPVVGLYGLNGIPYNVLINPEGKVIAENLKGRGLENKLAEVLQ